MYYRMTVSGEEGLEIRDVGRLGQGEHQLLPGLKQAVIGMKSGDEKQIGLSAEEAFDPYESRKKENCGESRPPGRHERR